MSVLAIIGIVLLSVVLIGAIFLLWVLWPYLSPPHDLYEPLVLEEIDISQVGRVYSFEFEHRYEGRHRVALVVDNPPPIASGHWERKLDIELEFHSAANELIFHKPYAPETASPFSGEVRSGLGLISYESPDDLPVNVPIICRLEITGENGKFLKHYRGIKFLISKISDK